MYDGVSKSFQTGRLERELQMVQLSATRCSWIAILWVSVVSFAAIRLCVASQRVFVVVVYFVIDSVRKLLDTCSYYCRSKWYRSVLRFLRDVTSGKNCNCGICIATFLRLVVFLEVGDVAAWDRGPPPPPVFIMCHECRVPWRADPSFTCSVFLSVQVWHVTRDSNRGALGCDTCSVLSPSAGWSEVKWSEVKWRWN
jgi:hypothetical protein